MDEPAQTRTLTFAVDRVFKGRVTATQVVTSHASGASCGVELQRTRAVPGLRPGRADRAHRGASAAAPAEGPAPASLGVGDQPLPDPARPTTGRPDGEPRSGMWIPLVGFILALTAAAVVGLSLVRPRSS